MSDIQLAAEALQSLRASSSSAASSPVPSTSTTSDLPAISTPSFPPIGSTGSVQLPPILPQNDSFFSRKSSKVTTSHNHHRHSPYHSRSSSLSSPAGPGHFLRNQGSSSSLVLDTSGFHSPSASPPSALSPTLLPQIHNISSIDSAFSNDSLLSPTSSNSSDNSEPKRTITSGFLNPIVSSAAKFYEQSKSYSPRFKYSAEKLESAISSRMGNYRTINTEPIPGEYPPQYDDDKTPTSSPSTPLPPISTIRQSSPQLQTQIKKPPRSTWQGVLVTASSIATSLSFENRQRLRYCLHLLKLANTHIASKVNQLQELLQEERATAMAQSIAANHIPNSGKNTNNFLGQKVNSIKRDIIWTIRKVVSALSTYAGNSLPEPARSHVRNYILRLPARWALSVAPSNPVSGTSTGRSTPAPATLSTASTKTANTPTIESLLSPAPSSPTEEKPRGVSSASSQTDSTLQYSPVGSPSASAPQASSGVRLHSDAEIGNRVLTLATEALEMLGSIISIVDETLEKAEVWCDRFGRVGIRPQQQQQQQQQQQHQNTQEVNGISSSINSTNQLRQRASIGLGSDQDVEMNDE